MANKPIYICDRCGSLISSDAIYGFKITGFANVISGMTPPELPGAYSRDREICLTCVHELSDELKLEKDYPQLVEEAFSQFELPRKKTNDDDTPF